MRKLLAGLLLTLAAAVYAVPPAGFTSFAFPGDVEFDAGGIDPMFLTGAYIKTATVTGDTLTITAQGMDGNDLADVTFTGVSSWIDLGDTPAAVTADLCVKGNSAGDALVFGPCLSAGTSDGVVDGISLVGTQLRLTRTAGLAVLTVDLPFRTDAEIDGRVAPFARAVSPSGTIADARIPAGIARDTEIRTDSQIDARIAPYARAAPTGEIADAQIPSSIARDSELIPADGVVTSGTFGGTTLTLNRSVGGAITISGIGSSGMSMADGVVAGGSISGTTLTLTRTESLPDVSITGLPTDTTNTISTATPANVAATGAAGSSGEVSDAGHVHGGFVDTNTQRTDADIDARIATWARATGATGTAPGDRLPGNTVHRENSQQTYNPTVGNISIGIEGTLLQHDLIVFDAPPNVGTDSSVNLSLQVGTGSSLHLFDREENRLNESHIIADAWYVVQYSGTSYIVLTSLEDVASWAQASGATGTAPVARLGTGTPSGTTFLAGDGEWKTVTAGTSNTISTATPQPVDDSPGAAGASGEVSDASHVHALDIDGMASRTTITNANDLVMDDGSGNVARTGVDHLADFIAGAIDDGVTLTASGGILSVANPFTNADETKLDGIATAASATWIGLTDTPASVTANLCVQGNSAGDALVFGACAGTGQADGVASSLDLGVGGRTLTVTIGRSVGADLTDTVALPASKVVYHNGNGPPATPPPEGGLLAIDNAGHLYGAVNQTITHTEDPAITSASVVTGGIGGYYRGYDTSQLSGTPGYFQYLSFNHQFRQLRSGTPNFITNASWNEITTYIHSVDSSTDYRQSVYLGSFADDDSAAAAMAGNAAALTNYGSGTPADTLKAYFINTTIPVLRSVESFTAGTTTTTVNRAWSNEALTIGALRGHLKPFVEAGTRGVRVGEMDSEAAAARQVPAADGSGGVAWQAQSVDSAGIIDGSVAHEDLSATLQKELPLYISGSETTYSNQTVGGAVHRAADLDVTGTSGASAGDVALFQWLDTGTVDAAIPLAAGLNGEAPRPIRLHDGNALRALVRGDVISGSPIYIVRTGTEWRLINGRFDDGAATFVDLSDTPAAITASQCVQGNAGGTALVFGACGTGGGGASAFTDLTDTPGAYTGASGYLVRVTSAGDALEFIAPPAPSHQILNVGRLPDPTVAGSPDLVYLTHDYTEGTKEDATLTVGFEGMQSGYSDGTYLQDSFGSINESSPLNALFGSGNAGAYSLQSVISFNLNWLDEFTHIEIAGTEYTLNPAFISLGGYERRIQANPTGLSAATLTVNFKRADGTWYWTDGGDVIHEAGLYEKVGNPPAYHDLAPIEDTHRSGSGNFACGTADPPTDGGQVCIDSDGEAWFATDRTRLFESEPEITDMTEFTSSYWTGAGSDIVGFQDTGFNGEFKWYVLGDTFFQIQGTRATATFNITGTENTVIPSGTVFERTDVTSTTHARTTADATIPVGGVVNNVPVEASIPGATGNNIPGSATWAPDPALTGVTSAVIQTGFTGGTGTGLESPSWEEVWEWIASVDDSDSAADQAIHEALRDNSVFLGEFSQTQDAAEDRDEYTITTDRYFYIIHREEGTIQEITGFTEGVSEELADHQWVGPVITIEDVHDVFEVNPSGAPQTRSLDSFRVGDNIYTSIVRPDEDTGDLRDAVAADWDHEGFSRAVAWDGTEWLEVHRTLVPGHGASVTWNEKALSTNFDNGNRWRGFFRGCSIHGASINDVIYDTNRHKFRRWEYDAVNFTNWCMDIPVTDSLFDELGVTVNHEYQNAADALANVTGNGEWFIYQKANSGGFGLFETAGFTAAAPTEYEYEWRAVLPLGLTHGEIFVEAPDPLTGRLRDAGEADYNGVTGTSRTLGFDGLDMVRAARRTVAGSPATGTWTTVGDGTALSSAFRWRGTHWQDYLVTAATPGDVYYNRTQGFRRRIASQWESTNSHTIFGDQGLEYLGSFNTEAEATSHAIADDNYAIIQVSGVPTLQRISGFTAATASNYEYYWTNINPPITLPPVEVPGSQDSLLRWSDTDARWSSSVLTTGDTITGIGTPGDPLNVQINNVIEVLQENVHYFIDTDADVNYSQRGASLGMRFQTGPHQTRITRLRAEVETGVQRLIARVYTVNPDNRHIIDKLGESGTITANASTLGKYFHFSGLGVTVPADTHIAILISRVDGDSRTLLRFGDQDSDSPSSTYDDAEQDYDYIESIEYSEVDPDTGDSPNWHNVQLHGAFTVYYTLVYDHGAFIGDDQVDLDHLADDVTARLLPASPNDDDIARYDSATSAWVAEALPAVGNVDGVVDTADLTLTGTTLTMTLGRTVGNDLADSVTLPVGGDITAVITNATSGLTGGAATGDATISLDFRRLTDPGSWTLENDDDYIALYSDDEGSMIRVTARNFASGIAATGRVGDITSVVTDTSSGLNGGSTSGVVDLEVDIKRLAQFPTATETIQGADIIALANESAGGDPTVEITLTEFFADILGDNLSWDGTDNQIDAAAGTTCTVYTTYSTADTYTACDVVVLTQAEYMAIATPTAGVIYKIRSP